MPYRRDPPAGAMPPWVARRYGADGRTASVPPGRARRGRWLAVVVSVIVQLPPALFMFTRHDPLADIAVLVAVAAGFLLALPWRAFVVIAVTALCLPAIALSSGPPLAGLPVAIAVVSAVLASKAVYAWSTLAGSALVGILVATIWVNPPPGIRIIVVTIVLCFFAAGATGARARRERFRASAHEATVRRQSAAEEERLRIARELHDVLAHSLSQISVQSGVALHLFDSQPEQARDALASIRRTSTEALDDVRSVLGVLRDDDTADRTSAPTLMRLAELADAASERGVTVDYRQPSDGVATLSTRVPIAVQHALYRIAQEALTNVTRHANVDRAAMTLAESPSTISIVVENGPAAAPTSPAPEQFAGGGRGILGMRERAELLGGTVDVGPTPAGGWRVAASFPVRPQAPAETAAEARPADAPAPDAPDAPRHAPASDHAKGTEAPS